MTALSCTWCGDEFERPHIMGPTPRYCGRGCRQRAYEARALERFLRDGIERAIGAHQ